MHTSNKLKIPKSNVLTLAYILFMLFFSFVLNVDLDKYIGICIVAIAFFMLTAEFMQKRFSLRKSNIDELTALGVTLAFLASMIQYGKYGIPVSVESLTLATIIITITLAKKFVGTLNSHYFLLSLGFGCLAFSVATINLDGLYYFGTGADGTLAAFILLIAFLSFLLIGSRLALLISCLIFLLLLLMGYRIAILSALIALIFNWRRSKKIYFALALSAILLTIFYFLNPDHRVFAIHTSGRVFHWIAIIDNFDYSNIIYGMGSGSAAQVLIDLGKIDSMAAPHNEYIRYIYDLGLIGSVLLGIILYKLYVASGERQKYFVLILAMQMFTDNVLTYYFNYLLPFIFLALIPLKQGAAKKTSTQMHLSGQRG